MSTAGSSD